jgi:hypothetical protein
MILRSAVWLSLSMALGALLPAMAQARPKPGGSGSGCGYNVSSTLNMQDSNNIPYQIQNDGTALYTAFSVRHNSVSSEILSGCDWLLDTTGSTTRGISLTFIPVDPNNTSAPFSGPSVVKARIVTHCATNPNNNNLSLGTMTYAGQTLICPFNVGFYAGSNWYNIALNPFNWPTGTTQALVTCQGVSGGTCNSWTIVPDPTTVTTDPSTGQLSGIGELVVPPCVGCSGGTGLGLYYFDYSFSIQK